MFNLFQKKKYINTLKKLFDTNKYKSTYYKEYQQEQQQRLNGCNTIIESVDDKNNEQYQSNKTLSKQQSKDEGQFQNQKEYEYLYQSQNGQIEGQASKVQQTQQPQQIKYQSSQIQQQQNNDQQNSLENQELQIQEEVSYQEEQLQQSSSLIQKKKYQNEQDDYTYEQEKIKRHGKKMIHNTMKGKQEQNNQQQEKDEFIAVEQNKKAQQSQNLNDPKNELTKKIESKFGKDESQIDEQENQQQVKRHKKDDMKQQNERKDKSLSVKKYKDQQLKSSSTENLQIMSTKSLKQTKQSQQNKVQQNAEQKTQKSLEKDKQKQNNKDKSPKSNKSILKQSKYVQNLIKSKNKGSLKQQQEQIVDLFDQNNPQKDDINLQNVVMIDESPVIQNQSQQLNQCEIKNKISNKKQQPSSNSQNSCNYVESEIFQSQQQQLFFKNCESQDLDNNIPQSYSLIPSSNSNNDQQQSNTINQNQKSLNIQSSGDQNQQQDEKYNQNNYPTLSYKNSEKLVEIMEQELLDNQTYFSNSHSRTQSQTTQQINKLNKLNENQFYQQQSAQQMLTPIFTERTLNQNQQNTQSQEIEQDIHEKIKRRGKNHKKSQFSLDTNISLGENKQKSRQLSESRQNPDKNLQQLTVENSASHLKQQLNTPNQILNSYEKFEQSLQMNDLQKIVENVKCFNLQQQSDTLQNKEYVSSVKKLFEQVKLIQDDLNPEVQEYVNFQIDINQNNALSKLFVFFYCQKFTYLAQQNLLVGYKQDNNTSKDSIQNDFKLKVYHLEQLQQMLQTNILEKSIKAGTNEIERKIQESIELYKELSVSRDPQGSDLPDTETNNRSQLISFNNSKILQGDIRSNQNISENDHISDLHSPMLSHQNAGDYSIQFKSFDQITDIQNNDNIPMTQRKFQEKNQKQRALFSEYFPNKTTKQSKQKANIFQNQIGKRLNKQQQNRQNQNLQEQPSNTLVTRAQSHSQSREDGNSFFFSNNKSQITNISQNLQKSRNQETGKRIQKPAMQKKQLYLNKPSNKTDNDTYADFEKILKDNIKKMMKNCQETDNQQIYVSSLNKMKELGYGVKRSKKNI